VSENQARDLILKVQTLIELDNVAMGGIEAVAQCLNKYSTGLPTDMLQEATHVLTNVLAKRDQLRKDAFPRSLSEDEG
jgi:hypothetical protein